jgi:hypothetical protein
MFDAQPIRRNEMVSQRVLPAVPAGLRSPRRDGINTAALGRSTLVVWSALAGALERAMVDDCDRLARRAFAQMTDRTAETEVYVPERSVRAWLDAEPFVVHSAA